MSGGHDLSGITYTGDGDHKEDRVAIVVAKWNPEITDVLFEGAKSTLIKAGVPEDNIYRYNVPGCYELSMGARIAIESGKHERPHAVICIGTVIQGETRHFEFIAEACARGIMQIGVMSNVPTIFGVLTPDTQQQALDRAGGKYGNKGDEAAVAALEMIDLKKNSKKESKGIGF